MSGLSSQGRTYLRLWWEATEVAENLTRFVRIECTGEMGHRCVALCAHVLDAGTHLVVGVGAKILVIEGGHILKDQTEAETIPGGRKRRMAIWSVADCAEPGVKFVPRREDPQESDRRV